MKQDIQVVIALNNRGAEELAAGDYPSASLSFSSAMKLLQAIAQPVPHQQPYRFKAQHTSPWTLEAVPVLCPELLEDNTFSVFEHCFIAVPRKGRNTGEYTREDRELYVAVLVYNLALVHHYSGICVLSLDRLGESGGLYELASNLIQTLQDTRDGLALFMAVSNNIASLSLVMAHKKMFRKYSRCLQQLLKERPDFHKTFFLKNLE